VIITVLFGIVIVDGIVVVVDRRIDQIVVDGLLLVVEP